MRLRKPCVHDLYDKHPGCSGGEFLASDAVVIEKVEGEWPMTVVDTLADVITLGGIRVVLDALALRVGPFILERAR